MALTTFATLAALGIGTLTNPQTDPGLSLAQAQPFIGSQGIRAPQSGSYMTTPDGCTYRRTQAPGYPPRWILVLNPHHLGKPDSPRRCKGMM